MQEQELVATNLKWSTSFPEERRTRSNILNISLENHFEISTFYVVLNSVIDRITHPFREVNKIHENFCFHRIILIQKIKNY